MNKMRSMGGKKIKAALRRIYMNSYDKKGKQVSNLYKQPTANKSLAHSGKTEEAGKDVEKERKQIGGY